LSCRRIVVLADCRFYVFGGLSFGGLSINCYSFGGLSVGGLSDNPLNQACQTGGPIASKMRPAAIF